MKTRLLPVLLLAATFPLAAYAQGTGSSGTSGTSSSGTGGMSSSGDNAATGAGSSSNQQQGASGSGTSGSGTATNNNSGTSNDQQNSTTTVQPSSNDTNSTMDSTTPGTNSQMGSTTGTFATAPLSGVWRVSDLQGKTVYGSDGANIGEINDVLISQNGSINAVLVGVGGFLGMGEKNVAVNMSALHLGGSSKDRITLNVTRDELKSAPAYQSASSK